MANQLPIYLSTTGQLTRFQATDYLAVAQGGTGGTTVAAAQAALSVTPGTYTQAYSLSLVNVAALSGTGFAVQTAANTWALRSLASTAGTIVITNPAGVAGNPAVDLVAVTNAGGGALDKFSVDTYGRISGYSAVAAGDLTPLLNGTYLALAGGTLTGALILAADPVTALGAATKQYVDGISSGMTYKLAARVSSAGVNLTLTGPGATIDGVTLAVGDRVLVKDQTTGSQNGIYVFQGSASTMTRSTDAPAGSTTELDGGATVWVNEGATTVDTAWTVITTGVVTIGTTAIVMTQTSGLGQVVAGNGLSKSGNTLSGLVVSASRLTVGGTGFDLAASGVTPGTYTKLTVDNYGRATTGATAVPADIGAQPAASLLTALAGAGIGILAATSGSAVSSVTITGTAGQIAVADGNGAAGNPTLALAATGVSAGTYNGVTVDVYGRVLSGTTSATSVVTVSLTNGTASAIAIGRAVYISGSGSVGLAEANASGTTIVAGLVNDTSIAAGAAGNIAATGVVTAATVQWDAVTGQSGGLTSGMYYYLSNATAGAITSTAPASGYVALVGLAMSSTQMKLQIERTVQM